MHRATARRRPDRIATGAEITLSDDLRLFDHTFEAGPGDHLARLDVFLVRRFPGYSRTNLARQIKEGRVTVNDRSGKKIRPITGARNP